MIAECRVLNSVKRDATQAERDGKRVIFTALTSSSRERMCSHFHRASSTDRINDYYMRPWGWIGKNKGRARTTSEKFSGFTRDAHTRQRIKETNESLAVCSMCRKHQPILGYARMAIKARNITHRADRGNVSRDART